MSWRFRRSFKLIPGLRLNLSKSGLSASIGGAPLTLNVSSRGVFGTASLPGTGIQFRQSLNSQKGHSAEDDDPGGLLPVDVRPQTLPIPASSGLDSAQEIRSARAEHLTSASLQDFKRILQTAYDEREDIGRELVIARRDGKQALDTYLFWKKGFVLKSLFKTSFATRLAASETASAKIAELEEQLRLTTVATHVEIAKDQAEPYFRLRDEFATLAKCAAIWDKKSHQATDTVRFVNGRLPTKASRVNA